MDKFWTLKENWNNDTIDPTKFSIFGSGGIEAVNQRLEMSTLTSAAYRGIETVNNYDLTNSQIYIEAIDAGNQSLSTYEVYLPELKLDANNTLILMIAGGTIYAIKKVASSNTTVGTLTYNSSLHRYFRIRELQGTIYFEVSQDLKTWVEIGSTATPFDITSMTAYYYVGTWSAEASTTKAILDNLNIEPAVSDSKSINYRILVKNTNGDTLGEFSVYKDLKFSKQLNDYGQCSFKVPITDPKARTLVALRRYEVYIYRREDSNYEGDLVWSGIQAVRKSKLDSNKDNWFELVCYTWLEILMHRYTAQEVVYDEIDGSDIAWDLIDDTQNDPCGCGDIGITEGSLATTMDRDRQYYNQNIGDGIVDLANVINGFDFEITDTKVFNTYTVKGSDKSEDVVFQYGINVDNVDITEDFKNAINRAIIIGQATDEDTLQRVERDNEDFQQTNKLYEGLLTETDVSELDTLQNKGDAMLRKYQLPLFTIEFDIIATGSPNITDFELGDLITIVVKEGIYDIQQSYRVFGIEITYDNDKNERLKLTLGDFTLYGT